MGAVQDLRDLQCLLVLYFCVFPSLAVAILHPGRPAAPNVHLPLKNVSSSGHPLSPPPSALLLIPLDDLFDFLG